jgi:hypothetical protein
MAKNTCIIINSFATPGGFRKLNVLLGLGKLSLPLSVKTKLKLLLLFRLKIFPVYINFRKIRVLY